MDECRPLPPSAAPPPLDFLEAGAAFVALSLFSLLSLVERRNLNLKAEVQSSISQFSFKCSVLGGLKVGFIGSSCTALPW